MAVRASLIDTFPGEIGTYFLRSTAADDNMGGMKMDGDVMSAMAPDTSALTDAVVKKVDASTGMVTLQDGEKVKVCVENVDGTPTIVTLMKR